jgi:transposase InsO family protein
MADRRVVIKRAYRRYQKADRAGKGRILDEIVPLTSYSRVYAAMVLRQWGTTHWEVGPRGPLRLVAGAPPRPRRAAPPRYDGPVGEALIRLWYLCDCMCGKRLVPAIRALLPIYQRWGELKVSPEVEQKLLSLSAATADRLLHEERQNLRTSKGTSHTRPAPSTLLRQIPLRTFDEWDRSLLGQVQADLVGHDGGRNQGDFAFTCTVTELSVGWSELRPVANKARVRVQQALEQIRRAFPIPIVALGTDSGSEFINNHLYAWCQDAHISFSRTRPYRKNDNCFVEEKNNSLVRRTVGYLRYDTPEQLKLLSDIYERQTVLSNYFYPWMKLVDKSRRGARVYRRYDAPRTPAQRLLEHPTVPAQTKQQLLQTFQTLNPAALKRELTDLQNQLYQFSSHRPLPPNRPSGRRLEIRPSPARIHRESSSIPRLESTVRQ